MFPQPPPQSFPYHLQKSLPHPLNRLVPQTLSFFNSYATKECGIITDGSKQVHIKFKRKNKRGQKKEKQLKWVVIKHK